MWVLTPLFVNSLIIEMIIVVEYQNCCWCSLLLVQLMLMSLDSLHLYGDMLPMVLGPNG
jgi:hypothetical protein